MRSNQAMQVTASNGAVYASSVCRPARMLRIEYRLGVLRLEECRFLLPDQSSAYCLSTLEDGGGVDSRQKA